MSESTLNLLSESRQLRLAKVIADHRPMLGAFVCVDPKLGTWIDEFGIPFLMEVLSFNDDEFSAFFPAVGMSALERERLLDDLADHVATCGHCQAKISRDLDIEIVTCEPEEKAGFAGTAGAAG